MSAVAADGGTVDLPAAQRSGWRLPRPSGARMVAAAGVGLAALILAWTIWQPEASERETNQALDLIDARDYESAIVKTEEAADTDPLSPEPLLVRAVAETAAGQETAARRTLEQAVLEFPGDPQTWLRLASFQLETLDRPEDAVETVRGVLFLDPLSQPGGQLFLEARARLRQKQAEAAAQQQPSPP